MIAHIFGDKDILDYYDNISLPFFTDAYCHGKAHTCGTKMVIKANNGIK
jgi:hypothetical protein